MLRSSQMSRVGFTSEYDDYKSAPVHDVTMKDGSTVKELNAVWYY